MPSHPLLVPSRVCCPDDSKAMHSIPGLIGQSEDIASIAEVIEGIAPRDLQEALVGRTLVAAQRKGKQMWFELDGDSPALLLHLGEGEGFLPAPPHTVA